MPTIVKNNSTKKLDNAIPIPNRFKQETYSNLSFPFGREFKLKLFDNSSQELLKYRQSSKAHIPIPGEGLPRVVHYCADQSGCAFWRMLWPSDELLAHNKAVVMTLYQMVTVGQFYQGIDAVRLQRQCTQPQVQFIKYLRELSDQMKANTGKGFRIIWEVDDIVCPAQDIPDYNVCKSSFAGDEVLRNVREVTQYVDEMTVVSEYMKNHYKKHLNFEKISVIPNYAPKCWIDRGYDREKIQLKYNKHKSKPRILYAGSGTHFDVENHVGQKDDFEHVVEAIIKDITLYHKYEWVFFGALPMKLRQFIGKGVEFHPWVSITEYTEKLSEMNVNITIAPLKNNNFSRSKANIKLTESGAQGVPCIAQNLECYNSDGWKYTFNDSDELFQKIDEIMESEESYMSASDFSREYAMKYILKDHLDEYLLLYTTEYGSEERKKNENFVRNNQSQFK